MAANVQLTAFFEQQQGDRSMGWSETTLLNYGNLAAAQIGAISGPGYLTARLSILGAGCVNTYNRYTLVQDGLPPIGSQLRDVAPQGGVNPTYGTTTQGIVNVPYYNPALSAEYADFAQNTLLIRLSTDPGNTPVYRRSLWLSSIPDAGTEIDQSGPLNNSAASAAVSTFLKNIANYNLSVRSLNRGAANPIKACAGIDATGLVYAVPLHGFAQNQLVEALGFRGPAGSFVPRGVYRINLGTTVNLLTLQGAQPASQGLRLGGFRPVSYVFTPIVAYTSRSWTNRKRGVPFGELRGRSRARTVKRA